MNSLVFPSTTLSQLTVDLLSSAPLESAAFFFAGSSTNNGTLRLLARECVVVPADGFEDRGSFGLTVRPEFIALMLKRARNQSLGLFLVHTHPFSKDPYFSPIDDRAEQLIIPTFFGRCPGPHGTLVVGDGGYSGRVYRTPQLLEEIDHLLEAGAFVRRVDRESETAVDDKYDRNVRAFGRSGQSLLRGLTVGIVGLGGTGSVVAQELAHLGVGRLVLIDHDAVAETNLNRLAGATPSSVGRKKVDTAATMVREISPNASIQAIAGDVTARSVVAEVLACDMAFICTDSHGSRAVLNQVAYQYFLPMIDVGVRLDSDGGGVKRIVGRIQMLAPGLPCLICQGLLNPEQVRRDLLSPEMRRRDPYIIGSEDPAPAVMSINATASSLAVTMFLSAFVGLPVATRHQIYLGDEGVVRRVAASADAACVVCSPRGAFGRGDSWSLPARIE